MTGTAAVSARRKRRSQDQIMGLILEAAETTFKQNGFSGATTAAIAARAEVTEAQLFRYFPSKAALFDQAVFEPLNRHFSDFMARAAEDGQPVQARRERARRYITELRQFLEGHSRTLMSLIVARTYGGGAMQGQGAGEIDSLQAYFEQGAAIMSSRVGDHPRVDPDLMVRVSFAAVLGCVLFKDWMFPGQAPDAGRIDEAIVDFVLDGIEANAQPAGEGA